MVYSNIEPYIYFNTKIVFIVLKANLSYILLFFSFFCLQVIQSQETEIKKSREKKTKKEDLLFKEKDSIVNDSIKKPKEVIDDIITHNADDYTIQNAKKQTLTLFNNAHITYQDIDLKAGKIIVNYKNNTVYATGFKDSTGYVQRPVFKQGSQESEQDSILFNFKSEKALIYGVKTLQGEMIAYAEKTKRVNDSTIYMGKMKFTTSEKKIPDYYISTNKAKLIPGKKIIVGGSNLVLADVPTPIYLPFAYFPLTKGRSSGLIVPTWGENNNQGFFLEGGGYYFAVNDYLDLETTATLYTNGSWGVNLSSNYKVRYKYSGNLRFSYQKLFNSIRGFDDFSKSTSYNINWSHSQDSKSSPNSRLSGSVNIGSNTFFQESVNQIDQSQFLTNTFSSSVSYYKKFVGTPFNLTTSLTHNQNTSSEEINMTLPSINLNMDRQFPFAGKGGIKKNPIQKLGFNYTLQGQNNITTTQEDFFTAEMFNNAKLGVQHSTSTSTQIKAFKYFTLSPSLNYEDTWYFDRIEKTYDSSIENSTGTFGAVVNDTIGGFNRFNEYSASASLSTNVYGTFNFKKGRLKTIRHTMRPSVSWSYSPDHAERHELRVRTNPALGGITTYTPFDEGIYGGPSSGISNTVSLSLNNVLEAKVVPKDEDELKGDEEFKKVTILNNLNFSTSYNIAADSLRWSDLNASASTRLFKDKLSLNLSARFDPYQVTDEGIRLDKFNSNLLRLESANLTANFSLSSKDFDGTNDDKNDNSNQPPPDVYGANINPQNQNNQQQQNDTKKDNKKTATLYQANVPWDISFAYSYGYSSDGFSTAQTTGHTVGFNGSIDLTPKWGVGFASSYDFIGGAFSYTRLNFSRDLDSWNFNFNWVPFGTRTSYNFFIGVKSSLLSDLKYDKANRPDILF